jgi:hypothetical protein
LRWPTSPWRAGEVMTRSIAAPQRVWHSCIYRIAIVAIFGSATAGCAHMRPTESWPELVQRLAPGKPVAVTTGSGAEVAGRVSAISADSLRLTVNGASQQFAPNDVRQVRRNGDSLWNGLAIGAAFGATAAALGDPRYYECGGSALCRDNQIPERVTFIAGATITGILIDWFHRDRRILYRPPSTQTPRSAGATKD